MQNDTVPLIEPINVRQFEFKQSKLPYEHADKTTLQVYRR